MINLEGFAGKALLVKNDGTNKFTCMYNAPFGQSASKISINQKMSEQNLFLCIIAKGIIAAVIINTTKRPVSIPGRLGIFSH